MGVRIEVVGADDASLGGGVCVVEACVWQEAAEGFHVGLCHGGGPRLYEIHAVCEGGYAVGSQL